jgi:hypothetical protein
LGFDFDDFPLVDAPFPSPFPFPFEVTIVVLLEVAIAAEEVVLAEEVTEEEEPKRQDSLVNFLSQAFSRYSKVSGEDYRGEWKEEGG